MSGVCMGSLPVTWLAGFERSLAQTERGWWLTRQEGVCGSANGGGWWQSLSSLDAFRLGIAVANAFRCLYGQTEHTYCEC